MAASLLKLLWTKQRSVEFVGMPFWSKPAAYDACCRRFVRSIKQECLERMIFFGEQSLRRALREYETHYLRERNHQGVGNGLLEPNNVVVFSKEPVQRRERLGGLLSYYHREAA